MPDELKKTEAPKAVQKVPDRAPKRIEAKAGTVKRKPFWKRMKDALFVESATSVADYLWRDVLLPAIKKLVADSATNAINMAVYGDNHPRNSTGITHVSNASVYSGRAAAQRNMAYYNRANRYQSILEGCLFSYKEVPMEIIHEAMDWIRDYNRLDVQTFNQMLPPELSFPSVYTDTQWGWTDLNENCIVPVPGGWTIDMPPAKPLM